ncbi:MAG: DUF418 domain-containing protein, partial [Muribaculaceae bacterium]|nr:DUF418 domain-containing protein [Muribaculaceae bacterium]
AVLMLQPVAIYNAVRAALDPAYVTPSIPTGQYWAAAFEMQSHGTFWETVKVNLVDGQIASLAWAWDHGRIFQTAALFILGMVIGRQGWLLRSSMKLWGRILAFSLIAFFPLHGLNAMLPEFIENANVMKPLGIILSSLSNLAFMFILVSGLFFAFYSTKRLSWLLSRLIPYGRMSMTNYVTQSIMGSFIFYNWGLGLHSHLGITASVGVGAVLFILQYAVCKWWMGAHHHGPMEWLWKRATWIDRNPFMRQS